MTVRHIEEDADRTFRVMRGGGVAILALDVGYGAFAGGSEGLLRIFDTKRRASHKRNGMIGNMTMHRDLHNLGSREREMVDAIVVDYNLPLGVIAPFHLDHPVLKNVDRETLARSTVGQTLSLLLNAGPLHDAIARRSLHEEFAILGSSANLTGKGVKYRLGDIEPEILTIADVVVDYGLCKYHMYRRSSTMIDFSTLRVVRVGICYELISDIMRRHFGVELPEDPGVDILPSGHLAEYAR